MSDLDNGESPLTSRSYLAHLTCGAVVFAMAMGMAWINLDQGWFSHDEGQLGQAAERVLAGELPHRDFDDMYTGALSFLNAFSFHLWGINSHSMRLMLLVWFAPFIIGIYWLTSNFARPLAAGLITLLAAAWSIPMYSAAMPSWYNLFFATWTLCAVIAYIKSGARVYLLAAGLLIGTSTMFKVSGLFVLAAVLLFLLYRNQESRSNDQTEDASPKQRLVLSTLITTAMLGVSSLSLMFVNQHDSLMQIVHLVIPYVSLTGLIIYREWTIARGTSVTRMKEFVGDFLAVGFGVAIPILALVMYYYQHDAIDAFIQGALVSPKKRIEFATAPFPELVSFRFTLPILLLLYPKLSGSIFSSRHEGNVWLVVLAGAVILLLTQYTAVGYSITFCSFRNLAPLLVLGNVVLMIRMRDQLSARQQQQLFLLTAVPFFLSLIQFPFAAPIYFFYAAPVLLLTALVAANVQGWVPKKALAVVLSFLLIFSCSRFHNPLPAICLNPDYKPTPAAELETERCSLRVDERIAKAFNHLQAIVASHTTEGEAIFATPDSPEISYLTNRPALNGVMYEFFRDDLYQDLIALKNELIESQVNLVVVKENPSFSPPVTDEFRHIVLSDFLLIEKIQVDTGERIVTIFTVYKRRPGGKWAATK